jgi:hypothetical protein
MIALDLRTVNPVQLFSHHKFSVVLGLAVGVMRQSTVYESFKNRKPNFGPPTLYTSHITFKADPSETINFVSQMRFERFTARN